MNPPDSFLTVIMPIRCEAASNERNLGTVHPSELVTMLVVLIIFHWFRPMEREEQHATAGD